MLDENRRFPYESDENTACFGFLTMITMIIVALFAGPRKFLCEVMATSALFLNSEPSSLVAIRTHFLLMISFVAKFTSDVKTFHANPPSNFWLFLPSLCIINSRMFCLTIPNISVI